MDGFKSSHLAFVECLLWSSEIIGFFEIQELSSNFISFMNF